MNENEILKEFNETWVDLLEKVSAFDEDEINRKPAPNKWSAAQVARHLIKANSGFPKMVSGETEEASRKIDEKITQIKDDFLNLDLPMNAADFLVPEEKIYEKKRLIESLKTIKSDIDEILGNTDLTKISKTFEFPVYGYLTGLETLAFIVYHTQRHIHQLDKLSSEIK